MSNGNTPSERFVAALCERSFLRLWTHPNPIGKNDKELCDCLIVCGAHIIIISVKECRYKDTKSEIGWDRWQKVAIERSVSQIWGAERWLHVADHVVRRDGRRVSLPTKENRKYHRISVSLGSSGQVPIKWGNFGNGFIHVCSEHSVGVLFGALDTITDLVQFLSATEQLASSGVGMIFSGGGIQDLVAFYLLHNRSFDDFHHSDGKADMIVLHSDLWEGFYKSDEYNAIQENFKDSYIWDRLIDLYTNDLLTSGMFDMHSKQVTDNELALVEMALQPRAYRASLASAFMEFLQNSTVASRIAKAHGHTAFVFLKGKSADREHRARELALRCFVVRGRLPSVTTVVGIAIDPPGASEIGYSSDIMYIHMEKWDSANELQVAGIQADLRYFTNVQWSK